MLKATIVSLLLIVGASASAADSRFDGVSAAETQLDPSAKLLQATPKPGVEQDLLVKPNGGFKQQFISKHDLSPIFHPGAGRVRSSLTVPRFLCRSWSEFSGFGAHHGPGLTAAREANSRGVRSPRAE